MEGESHCSFLSTPQVIQQSLLTEAWGKQKKPQRTWFSRNPHVPKGTIKVCLTQYTVLQHRNPIFQPCLPGISVGQINTIRSSLICPHCKEKMWTWNCSASQEEGKELLSQLCWTTCWWLIITLLNVWPSLLKIVLSHSMSVIHKSCSLCLLLPDIYDALESSPSTPCSPVFQKNLSSRHAGNALTGQGPRSRFPLKTKKGEICIFLTSPFFLPSFFPFKNSLF